MGPFFGMALSHDGAEDLAVPARHGAIRLHGRVLDGAGEPVTDALVELWQTGSDGAISREDGSLHRDGWTFTGWGRAATNRMGEYRLTTVRPARPDGGAPFFALTVFARGLLDRLFTRAYLPGDVDALARDAFLSALDPARRHTMVATSDAHGYLFDVRLQGRDETVFLNFAAGASGGDAGDGRR